MQKLKNVLYEHRIGLFFFLFLLMFALVYTEGFFEELGTGKTYSIYAVDFSVGFCTRLLPGAIFNLIYDEVNTFNVSIHYYTILIVCFVGMAFLGEVSVKKFEQKERVTGFIMVLLLFSAFSYCAVRAISVELLDLHWFLSVVAFFLCLMTKKLYIFIPLTFWYAIMSHNACVLCYIPMFVLILIFKVISTTDKKEKTFLGVILAISFISSVGLFLYMMLFESANLNFTMEEFDAFLQKRGVSDRNYYIFPYYRDVPEGLEWAIPEEILSEANAIRIDFNEPKLIIMIKTVLQQIQINLYMADHTQDLLECSVYLPAVLVCFIALVNSVKCKTVSKIKKFVFVNSMLLFIFVIAFGLLFSTDTERWFGHATISLAILSIYVFVRDCNCREEFARFFEKMPLGISGLAVITMATSVFW